MIARVHHLPRAVGKPCGKPREHGSTIGSAVLAVAVLLFAAAAVTAGAHVPVNPIVAERQASMKEMALAAKTIAGMFNGNLAYDASNSRMQPTPSAGVPARP
jgi:hypothetical protein